MIEVRRTTVLADARRAHERARASHLRRLALVRVGATKEWTYTDGNGVEWAVEDRAGDVPAGQRFKASTEAYPDSTYAFYEPTQEALYAVVEGIAKSQAGTESYAVGGGGDAGPKGGSDAAEEGVVPGDASKDSTPSGGGVVPGDDGAAPSGQASVPRSEEGIVDRFKALSTPKKVGAVAIALLVVGGVVWTVL